MDTMNQHRFAFFHSVTIFAHLSVSAMREIMAGFRSHTYARGEILFLEEESATTFFVVAAGRVRLFKTSVQGREFTFSIAHPRQVFNLPPIFDNKPHPLSASALSDARVYLAPLSHIQSMANRFPEFYQALTRELSTVTRRIARIASDLALTNVSTRLARLLIVSSESEGYLIDEGVMLSWDLSQSEIAHLLGTAREVVSRALRQMEKEGIIIRTRRGILISDRERLKTMARMTSK